MDFFANLIFLCLSASFVRTENILTVITTPSRSHGHMIDGLLRDLSKVHKITILTPKGYEMKNPNENITNIVADLRMIEEVNKIIYADFDYVSKIGILQISDFLQLTERILNEFINHKNIQNLLKSDEKFDLVLGESNLNEAILGEFVIIFDELMI